MQKGRGLPEITKLGRYSASHTLLKYKRNEAWEDVSTLLFTHLGEHLPVKEMIREQREIRIVRMICEQIRMEVGCVKE